MTKHAFPRLAREAVEHYVTHHEVLKAPDPLPEALRPRAGVFVSLHLLDGRLRGCIGTIDPLEDNLALEIIRNAIAAASRDPRFEPVGAGELASMDYSVDVLSESEPISGVDELDPARYGVIVASGRRKGLLLPAIEGIDRAPLQLAVVLEKAGILPSERYQLSRFEVTRYH